MVDNNGYLWIGTISGLSVINIETDEIIDMSKYISTDKYIKHMYQDDEGNYYLGLLKDEGLCYINVKEKIIKYQLLYNSLSKKSRIEPQSACRTEKFVVKYPQSVLTQSIGANT